MWSHILAQAIIIRQFSSIIARKKKSPNLRGGHFKNVSRIFIHEHPLSYSCTCLYPMQNMYVEYLRMDRFIIFSALYFHYVTQFGAALDVQEQNLGNVLCSVQNHYFLLALLRNFVLALFSLHPFFIEFTMFVVIYAVYKSTISKKKRGINLIIHLLRSQIAPVASMLYCVLW